MTTRAQLMNLLQQKEEKYYLLVWSSRCRVFSGNSKSLPPGVAEGQIEKMRQIFAMYPEEMADLQSEDGLWHHGFNSGMLAGMRYAIEAFAGNADFAEDTFPDLDT
jgi:hypothetical protein